MAFLTRASLRRRNLHAYAGKPLPQTMDRRSFLLAATIAGGKKYAAGYPGGDSFDPGLEDPLNTSGLTS